MSEKLTPEKLQLYRDHMNNYAVEALLDHIAAVEAERDALAALVREVAKLQSWSTGLGFECSICGTHWCVIDKEIHLDDCLIPRARQALAAMDNASQTNSERIDI